MKDLYFMLEIEPGAGEEEIITALELKPELSEYSGILLNPERRALYDGAHLILKTIGTLRNRLRLDTGHSWFLENCPDFALSQGPTFGYKPPEQGPNPVMPQVEDGARAPSAARRRKSIARLGKMMPVVLGLIGVIAVVLILSYFYLL